MNTTKASIIAIGGYVPETVLSNTDLEKRITEFQQTAEADLQKKEQELLQPVIDKAKEAINK